MRAIVYGLFLMTPILLFQTMLVPELEKLKDFYANMDSIVQQQIISPPDSSRTAQITENYVR
jgi:hypothetical protein